MIIIEKLCFITWNIQLAKQRGSITVINKQTKAFEFKLKRPWPQPLHPNTSGIFHLFPVFLILLDKCIYLQGVIGYYCAAETDVFVSSFPVVMVTLGGFKNNNTK